VTPCTARRSYEREEAAATGRAELLIEAGRSAEAVTHCAIALQHAPTDEFARTLMTRALSPQAEQAPATQPAEPMLSTTPENETPESTPCTEAEQTPDTTAEPAPSAASPIDAPQDLPTSPEATTPPAPESSEAPAPNDPTSSDGSRDFDWRRAEEDFGGGPAAPFVSSEASESSEKSSEQSSGSDPALSKPHPVKVDDRNEPTGWEVERTGVCLADVGGMIEVKKRLEASFLAPMRNPELRQLYGKNLRGGLLLYGPPGTGKTSFP